MIGQNRLTRLTKLTKLTKLTNSLDFVAVSRKCEAGGFHGVLNLGSALVPPSCRDAIEAGLIERLRQASALQGLRHDVTKLRDEFHPFSCR